MHNQNKTTEAPRRQKLKDEKSTTYFSMANAELAPKIISPRQQASPMKSRATESNDIPFPFVQCTTLLGV